MSELIAKFEKRFSEGATIQADIACLMDNFSISVLYGPSGCGKTTILRCLAGLELPESGTIRVGTDVWMDAGNRQSWPPQQRDVGFLFQEYALFPHLTVLQNIGYGLTNLSRKDRQRLTAEMSERLGLCGLEQRYPNQISGGQKQRVALARVLARRPRLLLLDEPLSALDVQIRDQVRLELRRLLSDFAIPVILVTHDRIEALTFADQMIIMDQGRILQSGTPDLIYRRPNSVAVARMMGIETIESARVVRRDIHTMTLQIGDINFTVNNEEHTGDHILACIRAEDVQLNSISNAIAKAGQEAIQFAAKVDSVTPEGPLVRVTLTCDFLLTALMTRPDWGKLKLNVGDAAIATVPAAAIHLIAST